MHISLGAWLVIKRICGSYRHVITKTPRGGLSSINWEIALKCPGSNPGWTYSSQHTSPCSRDVVLTTLHMPLLRYLPCHHDEAGLVCH